MHVYFSRQACAYEVSLYLIRSLSLNVRSMQIRSIFLSLPLELDFFRSMLDRSKPFTLDKDRFFLHRSSLDRFICASVNGVPDTYV